MYYFICLQKQKCNHIFCIKKKAIDASNKLHHRLHLFLIFDLCNSIREETKQLIVEMGGEIEKYRRTRSWRGKIFNRGNSGPRINSAPPLFVARPRDRKSVRTLIVVIFLVAIVNTLRVRDGGLWAHS